MSMKNPCTFLLVKEKTLKSIVDTNSELLQNHTEKQIIQFETTVNWPFKHMLHYLIISCFD